MLQSIAFIGCLLLLLSACAPQPEAPADAVGPPFVKTTTVRPVDAAILQLSGTVRARYETPLAFQVGGRIAARQVDAGQRIKSSQVLFTLDPRDLEEGVRAARADLAAAEATLRTAQADVERFRRLTAQNFISRQGLERAELTEQETRARLKAAQARFEQARNALGYARLTAPAAGILIEVTGEPGQVVAAGQPVAVLAREGEREVETFFPDTLRPPAAGRITLTDGTVLELRLRDVSGAVDPQSRTWRARYRVAEGGLDLALGSVVRAAFEIGGGPGPTLEVPIGALDERGAGPRLWRVIDGRAEPMPVEVLALTAETARIRADLPEGSRVIALGTHLLAPGMAVRERAP
jgi:RND family efflux transporter MFP subunit